MVKEAKSALRHAAKVKRASVRARAEKAEALVEVFPVESFKNRVIAGFLPIHDEIDVRPLLTALYQHGAEICLPVTGAAGMPLVFRQWTPQSDLQSGRFGTMEPKGDARIIRPDFIFLPLLAFNFNGDRLGYGGGYYDRTIADLRESGAVFTCGVGFDEQETANIPTRPHDIRLEAVLIPSGFYLISD